MTDAHSIVVFGILVTALALSIMLGILIIALFVDMLNDWARYGDEHTLR